MATREYVGLGPTTAQPESETLLFRAVEHLCAQETDAWSIASLSAALGLPEESFRKEFGTEETLVQRVREVWSQFALAVLSKSLRVAKTGREAIHGLLETAISLQSGCRRLRNNSADDWFKSTEQTLDTSMTVDCSRSLAYPIQKRFELSVFEGELPENANVPALTALCWTLLKGFLAFTDEQNSSAMLVDSVKLLVEGLGFQPLRRSKRVPRRLSPVLAFVRKPQR